MWYHGTCFCRTMPQATSNTTIRLPTWGNLAGLFAVPFLIPGISHFFNRQIRCPWVLARFSGKKGPWNQRKRKLLASVAPRRDCSVGQKRRPAGGRGQRGSAFPPRRGGEKSHRPEPRDSKISVWLRSKQEGQTAGFTYQASILGPVGFWAMAPPARVLCWGRLFEPRPFEK